MKKNLLIACDYFYPSQRAGGPLRVIRGMAELLAPHYNVKIVTRGWDLGVTATYAEIQLDAWNQLDDLQVYYTSPQTAVIKNFLKILRQEKPDIVFINSFFSPQFGLVPLLMTTLFGIKLICAPRGELSLQALGIKSWKKRLYLLATQSWWKAKAIFVVSSEKERQEIQHCLSVAGEHIKFLPEFREFSQFPALQKTKIDNKLSVVFLARINPIKNLQLAIEAIAAVKNVTLDIWGPVNSSGEESYLQQSLLLARSLGAQDRVAYRGSLPENEVLSLMSRYDLYFVPSKTESFGHGFLEALCAGLPVLASDQIPWEKIASLNLGSLLPLDDTSAFIDKLTYYRDLPQEEHFKIRQKCQTHFPQIYESDKARHLWLDMFIQLK